MAGDWIPWSKGLTKREEVRLIAAATGRDRRWVASVMMELWEYADSETTDGFIPAVPEAANLTELIPDTSAVFWSAVADEGWLVFRNGGVQIPNFDHWLGHTAKERLRESRKKRKQRKREPCPDLVPELSPPKGTSCPVLSLSSSGKEGFGEKGGNQLEGPRTAEGWPGWLTGEWLKHFTGTHVSERDHVKLKGFFAGLIAEGFKPDEIRDGIRATAITIPQEQRRPGRQCSWEFADWLKARHKSKPTMKTDPAELVRKQRAEAARIDQELEAAWAARKARQA